MTFENGIFFNCLSYERRGFYAILKMRVDSYKLFRISLYISRDHTPFRERKTARIEKGNMGIKRQCRGFGKWILSAIKRRESWTDCW